jgi:RHS repeat-associated protein
VVKVTNAAGSVDQALAFDAWGLRRNASDWSALGSPFSGSHETERGYTGHEHLDPVGLIHTNGRVQDPLLGRFISADPLIQSPYSTQSHNRYSYVWNNPVSFTDPSGFDTIDPDGQVCPVGVDECMVVQGQRPPSDCDLTCLTTWMQHLSGRLAALESETARSLLIHTSRAMSRSTTAASEEC